MEEYVADGICDDLNNHEKCNFDGGDCCGGSTYFCIDCFCHAFNEETEVNPSMTPFHHYSSRGCKTVSCQSLGLKKNLWHHQIYLVKSCSISPSQEFFHR